MRLQKSVDMFFTTAGDFVLDEERGDFLDTKNASSQDLIQRVYTRVLSDPGSWNLQQHLGAGLSRFTGMPNTERTGLQIKQAIVAALIEPGFLTPKEILVEVFPITQSAIAMLIQITPEGSTTRVRLNLTMDLRDGSVVPRNI